MASLPITIIEKRFFNQKNMAMIINQFFFLIIIMRIKVLLHYVFALHKKILKIALTYFIWIYCISLFWSWGEIWSRNMFLMLYASLDVRILKYFSVSLCLHRYIHTCSHSWVLCSKNQQRSSIRNQSWASKQLQICDELS